MLAARPDRSLLLVAGVVRHRRAVAAARRDRRRAGWDGGWLTSATTGRDGYLQLVDLAPTALAALGRPMPERLFAGQPAASVDGPARRTWPTRSRRPPTPTGEARRPATVVGLVLRAAGRRCRSLLVAGRCAAAAARPAGTPARPARARAAPRLVAVVEVLLIAAALAVPAALLADAVPWWRGGRRGLVFGAGHRAAAGRARPRPSVRLAAAAPRTLGPLGVVAGRRRRWWSASTC